jgi:hypothetical protein
MHGVRFLTGRANSIEKLARADPFFAKAGKLRSRALKGTSQDSSKEKINIKNSLVFLRVFPSQLV